MSQVSELEQSRIDAVREIAAALCFAAGDVLKVHGADPSSKPILAAGFSLAIEQIDRQVVPNFKQALKSLL